MRTGRFLLFVSLVVGVISITSCADNDDIITETPNPNETTDDSSSNKVTLTGTLMGKGATTSRSVDASGKTSWQVGEEIAVYYQTNDGSNATAKAVIQSVESDTQEATYRAMLDNPKSGSVSLVYPFSMNNGSGGYTTSGLLSKQKGTIADISNNWDLATTTETMTVNGSKATLPDNITLKNQLCICHFTLKKYGTAALDVPKDTEFSISDGTNNYSVTPTETTNELYVAMLPTSAQNFQFSLTTPGSYGIIYTLKDGVSLNNVTSDNVGDVVDVDGKIYGCSRGSVPKTFSLAINNVTLRENKMYNSTLNFSDGLSLVAMIAYVGDAGTADTSSGSESYRGLAMALEDVDGLYAWELDDHGYADNCTGVYTGETNADNFNFHKGYGDLNGISNTNILAAGSCYTDQASHVHPAAKAAKNYSVKGFNNAVHGCSQWFLPSSGQWFKFIFSCKDDVTWTNGGWETNSDNPHDDYAAIVTNKIEMAGSKYVGWIWSSSPNGAWGAMNVYFGYDEGVRINKPGSRDENRVRPFFAF